MKPPKEFVEQVCNNITDMAVPLVADVLEHFKNQSPLNALYFSQLMLCFGVESFRGGDKEEVLKDFRTMIEEKGLLDFAEHIVIPWLESNSNEVEKL